MLFNKLNLLGKLGFAGAIALIFSLSAAYAQNKKFEYEDIMKFKTIKSADISDDGMWAFYSIAPDWGDGEACVKSTEFDVEYVLPRGKNPDVSANSVWATAFIEAPALETLNAKSPKDKTNDSLAIINLQSGDIKKIPNVDACEFSNDSRWLVYKPHSNSGGKGEGKNRFKQLGSDYVLRHLESGTEIILDDLIEYHIDSSSTYIFYVRSEKSAEKDGLYARELKKEFCPEIELEKAENYLFANLAWNNKKGVLAYSSSKLMESGEPEGGSLRFWSGGDIVDSLAAEAFPEGWYIPAKNELKWTEDGERLFFGLKPVGERYPLEEKEIKFSEDNFYNIDTITAKTESHLWHGDDNQIKTYDITNWNKTKDKIYRSVYHFDAKKFAQLADSLVPDVQFADNAQYTVGYNEVPYQKEQTWNGWFQDLYAVSIADGSKKKIIERLEERARLSPQGNFILYFIDKDWYLYAAKTGAVRNLTETAEPPFHNVEHDLPANFPPAGFGGWFEDDHAVYLYDNWDLWKFHAFDPSYQCITIRLGEEERIRYRLLWLDPDKKAININDTLYMSGFDEKDKSSGIYRVWTNYMGMGKLIADSNFTSIRAKAKNAQKFLVTRQRYDLYPDLQVCDSSFKNLKKLTDLNAQLEPFNWGKTKLVLWKDPNGNDLEGYVILPDDYDPDKRYPTLVYFYEQFSDYRNRFFRPAVNHRPCYPNYIGDGYIVFSPDIKYRFGFPGKSSLDALLSGSRHIAELGYADSTRMAIQGHSWGGYETAYIVTQTDFFKAACAGAPVSNMTSAYSGIRLGTGLARQFQYEKFQSRIGGNLWDSLDNYLNNSPIFEAESAETPFLIMFGDVDEAVPWQQGIELYLAWRRLDKEIYFLQYENEPHHPRKYWNKLDYNYKMKQFFNHYLLGEPKPDWMKFGVEYRGY